jgi:pilus assembly protein Flp/PilA
VQNLYASLVALASVAKDRLRTEKGATAVEYGLLVALIAAVIITTVILLGDQINAAFTTITDGLTDGGVVVP